MGPSFFEVGFSSGVPAIRPLYPNFSNTPVLIMCAYLCFGYALLKGSKHLNGCGVGYSCRLKAFCLVILSYICFYLGVYQYSPFLNSDYSGSLYCSPGNIYFESVQI